MERGTWNVELAWRVDVAQMGELIELSNGLGLRVITVQIMRPGTFVDMSGQTVTITPEDLGVYAANFAAGVAGQELPVFFGHPAPAIRAAEPAAAWFRSLVVQEIQGEKRLVAEIELSDIGQAALEGGRYRYFSPTIDLTARVVKGGGFVNLPAIKGLPAIELGAFLVEAQAMDDFKSRVVNVLRELFGLGGAAPEGAPPARESGGQMSASEAMPKRCYLYTPGDDAADWKLPVCEIVDGEPTITVAQLGRAAAALGPGFRGQEVDLPAEAMAACKAKLRALYQEQGAEPPEYIAEGGEHMEEEKLRAAIRQELEAEFAEKVKADADLAERVRAEERAKVLAELTERAALEKECADFAAQVTGGEAGLSTPADEVKAFLLGLTPEQREAAKKLLQQKVVDFSEHGHTGAGPQKQALPKLLADTLRSWLAMPERAKQPVAASVSLFCEANGINMAEYDLSEWLPVDK